MCVSSVYRAERVQPVIANQIAVIQTGWKKTGGIVSVNRPGCSWPTVSAHTLGKHFLGSTDALSVSRSKKQVNCGFYEVLFATAPPGGNLPSGTVDNVYLTERTT
jgi:hypothetical protein